MVVYRADVELYFKNFQEAEEWFYEQKHDAFAIVNVLTADLILNSPQFKKQYAKIPKDGKNPYEKAMKNIPRTLQHKREELRLQANAYAEGQQNPDPKQYAKREELVKEILKSPFRYPVECRKAMEVAFTKVVKIIENHGLEE